MTLTNFINMIMIVSLSGCAAQNANVSTSKSPIDGKSRVTIEAPPFSTSFIYPSDGKGMGIAIEGGSVIDKEKATIVFSSQSGAMLDATFKADDLLIKANPVGLLNDYDVNKYGSRAIRSFAMSCDEIQKIASAQHSYVRINYANGFVDYSITDTNTPGTDGIGMIRKISSYCE